MGHWEEQRDTVCAGTLAGPVSVSPNGLKFSIPGARVIYFVIFTAPLIVPLIIVIIAVESHM
jgi:hypothetical protein